MATQADLARGWMQKGDSDRLDAERGVHSSGPYDTACFHCQQAVEKYLKALLAFAGQPIPRTHDLEEIYELCLGLQPGLNLDRMELANLTPYAVQLRYDADFWPDLPTAEFALLVVIQVRGRILAMLPANAHP